MVFRVPISFAHCNGVSTLKGACMNQIEREEEGEEKRGTGVKGGGKGGREGDVGEKREESREKEGGEQREGEGENKQLCTIYYSSSSLRTFLLTHL